MAITYNTILVIVIVVLIILALVVLAINPIKSSQPPPHVRVNTSSPHHLPVSNNPDHISQVDQFDKAVIPKLNDDPDMSGFYDNRQHVTFCNSTLGSNGESKYYIDLLTDFTKFANTIANNSKYMHGKMDGVDDQDDYNYEPITNTNPNATIWDTTKN
ncbi:Hypothetical protein MVR_LOCUS167 [uncultured virus]|nr:Hypothetical protein MVR_LOCUS167 [uncultured virus]